MKIDIYMPRLDITFKQTEIIPEERSEIIPIRKHWIRFLRALINRHEALDHEVRLVELPLWLITTETVRSHSKGADRIYIPHKMRANWWLDDRVLYYMQMVIPNIFSIDSHGWCASASSYPILPNGSNFDNIYENLRERVKSNTSKFEQPEYKDTHLEPGYIFFPCQLPHDETIKFHSDVEVSDALKITMKWVSDFNSQCTGNDTLRSLVIKGHPANPSSMLPLRQIFNDLLPEMRGMAHWVDDMSIHQLIANSRVVVSVNSGVGLEAILHGKSIFVFGRADYDSVNKYSGKISDLPLSYRDLNAEDILIYKKFISSWYGTHYDYENPNTFNKIN